jgi:hypothetical protein
LHQGVRPIGRRIGAAILDASTRDAVERRQRKPRWRVESGTFGKFLHRLGIG